jgi:integrase
MALAGVRGRIPGAVLIQLVEGWKKRHSPWTTYNKVHGLRKICRAIDGQLRTHLAEEVPKFKEPPARKTIITDEELARLLAVSPPAIRLFVALMSHMALRFAEAKRAAPENYNAETRTLTIETKGGRIKRLPVPDEIAALFAMVPTGGEGGFVERLHGRKLGNNWLRKLWIRAKKKAGVRDEVNPHDLRRTACVRIYSRTKDLYAAKELLAHDSLSSTAHYLQAYEPEAVRGVRKALLEWIPLKGEPKQ